MLREDVADWFEIDDDSPYMLLVADVPSEHRIAMTDEQQRLFGIDKLNVPRSTIPAVTHVDYSARVADRASDTNPRFHALISRFKELTGCPVLVNTSFNVRGEPIVCTPEDPSAASWALISTRWLWRTAFSKKQIRTQV